MCLFPKWFTLDLHFKWISKESSLQGKLHPSMGSNLPAGCNVPVSKPVDQGNVFWMFNAWLYFQARYQMNWSGSLESVETVTGPAFQILERLGSFMDIQGPGSSRVALLGQQSFSINSYWAWLVLCSTAWGRGSQMVPLKMAAHQAGSRRTKLAFPQAEGDHYGRCTKYSW